MRNYSNLLGLIILTTGFFQLHAQVMIKAEPGKVMHLEEIQSIITEKKDGIIVEAVLPVESRLEPYRKIRISKNDTVLMANGNHIASVRELEKMYRDFPVGGEFKLGVRGKDGLRIIAFKKASPDAFPKKQMMKMTVENEGGNVTKKVIDENGKEWTGEDADRKIREMNEKAAKQDSSALKIEIEDKEP